MFINKGVLRQLEAAIAAVLASVSTGTCFGWIAPILSRLLAHDSEIPMTSSQISWMIALIEVGNLFSPIPAGILSDKVGRKPCILSTGPIYFISWIIILNIKTFEALCFARVLQGISMGIVFTVVPLYLGEISSPQIRGAITSTFQSGWCFGYLLEYCIGPYVSFKYFTIITSGIPIIFFITFIWQPESPYFLVMKRREIDAAKSLAWLRGKAAINDVSEELGNIIEAVKKETNKRGSWKDVVATATDRRALLIVQVVGAVKIFSGVPSVFSYSTLLFTRSSSTFFSPDELTIIMGAVMFVASFLSSAITDIVGRRPLLIMSTIGCGFSLLSVAIYFYIHEKTKVDVTEYSWIAPLSIILYCVFLSLGLDPVSITYRSEMFPANTRGVASSITSINFTIGSFITLKFYQIFVDHVGHYIIYVIFSITCFIGVISMYSIAVETKGKTLSEVQLEITKSATKTLPKTYLKPDACFSDSRFIPGS